MDTTKGNHTVLRISLIPIFVALVVFLICVYFQKIQCIDVFDFYKTNMRASLFAGFLTLGSFLLSLKTGIIIKIKENLYDSQEYSKTLEEARKSGVSCKRYAPLRRLSFMLSFAVGSALTAAVFQLTIGLIPLWWIAAICLSIAACALTFLFISFFLIQISLNDWFDFLEKKDESSVTA